MAKKSNLATVLKADLATNIPLKMLAEMVRSQGRGRDTVLAHITPREAAKLKREGGSGTTNPATGLPEFEDFGGGDFMGAGGADYAAYAPEPSFEQRFAPTYEAVGAGTFDQTGTLTLPPAGGATFGPSYAEGPAAYGLNAYAQAPSAIGIEQPTMPLAGAGAPAPPPPLLAGATAGAGGGGDAAGKTASGGGGDGAGAAAEPSAWEKATGKGGFLEGLTPLRGLTALGGLGLGLYQQQQARRQAADLQAKYDAAAEQQRAQAQAQQALAQPFLTQGAQMTGLAAQGAFTASQQQAFDAYRARVAQEASRQGGAVAAAQVGAVEERARQQSLNNQMQQGLALFGRGTAEYNASVSQLNAALSNELQGYNSAVQFSIASGNAATGFYTQLAQFAAGGALKAA